MWGVIRTRQGLPPNQKAQPGFAANARHLVAVACQPNPEELPEEAVTLGFERATHPKLTKLVASGLLVHRQKALTMIDRLCSSPVEVVQFLEAGLVPVLVAAAEDADETVRALASHVLLLVAREKAGRDLMRAAGCVQVLQRLLSDGSEQVRSHAYRAVAALCVESAHPNCDEVVLAGTVAHLVERTAAESDAVMPHVLFALKMCMQHPLGLSDALERNAIAAMAPLVSSASPAVREGACHNLFCLAVPAQGKADCQDSGSAAGLLPRLVQLLSEPHPAVQAEAAGALMALTVSVPAKLACIACGACEALVAIVADEGSGAKLRTNAAKAMAMLAEAPKGRVALLGAVPTLEAIERDGRFAPGDAEHAALLRAHAKRAREIIAWTP